MLEYCILIKEMEHILGPHGDDVILTRVATHYSSTYPSAEGPLTNSTAPRLSGEKANGGRSTRPLQYSSTVTLIERHQSMFRRKGTPTSSMSTSEQPDDIMATATPKKDDSDNAE